MELSVDAQRKTIFERYSVVDSSSASMTRTPLTRFLSLSYASSVTIDQGFSVRRPVAMAAGSVDDCVLNAAP